MFRVTLNATATDSGISITAKGWGSDKLKSTASLPITWVTKNETGGVLSNRAGYEGKQAYGSFTVSFNLGSNETTYGSGSSSATINISNIDAYSVYKEGWNNCRSSATSVAAYSRNAGPYGGSTTHYYKDGTNYVSCGSGWYTTTALSDVYKLPDAKS